MLWAASACVRFSVWRRATQSARPSRTCFRRPPRWSSCPRSRSSPTTCPRSTGATRAGTEERRGEPSVWARDGEPTAILAGDALLVEAMRLALTYPTGSVARELVDATLAMIGGQQLDLEGGAQLDRLHSLKTGALFSASVMCALWAADVPVSEHEPWRAFAGELGLLFQIVDDLLDGDGYVLEVGEDGARRLADEAAERAHAALVELDADTDVLASIVDDLAVRTA